MRTMRVRGAEKGGKMKERGSDDGNSIVVRKRGPGDEALNSRGINPRQGRVKKLGS